MSIYSFLSDNYQIEVKNKKLMEDAFTHASYLNETKSLNSCYERLEFMGDAVVELWVSEKLFNHVPAISEGKMTTMRAQLVCEKSLAQFNRKLGLAKYIRFFIYVRRFISFSITVICAAHTDFNILAVLQLTPAPVQ